MVIDGKENEEGSVVVVGQSSSGNSTCECKVGKYLVILLQRVGGDGWARAVCIPQCHPRVEKRGKNVWSFLQWCCTAACSAATHVRIYLFWSFDDTRVYDSSPLPQAST